MIEIICCVCEKSMGTKDGKGIHGISHSYCEECLKKELKKMEEEENELCC